MKRTILCKWTRSLTFATGIWISFWSALTRCATILLLFIVIISTIVVTVVSFISYSLSYSFGLAHFAVVLMCLVRSFIAQTADSIRNTHLNTCSVYYYFFRAMCERARAYWLNEFLHFVPFYFHFPFVVFSVSISSWLLLLLFVSSCPSYNRCSWWPRAYSKYRVCVRVSAWLPGIFNISLFIKFSYKNTLRICTIINCCCYLLNIKIRTNENSRRLKRLNKLSVAPARSLSLSIPFSVIRLENALWKRKIHNKIKQQQP